MGKVLIIGPEFFDYNISVANAFEHFGFETSTIGYSAGTVTSIRQRIKYHLSGNKKSFFDNINSKVNAEVLKEYKRFKPDIVFIIHGGVLFPETMNLLKSCKKALWMMDSLARGGSVSPFIKSLDYIFSFEKIDVDFLWNEAKINSWFLPLAVDPTFYHPVEIKQDIDILFVGALYENRVITLNRVVEEFKERNIKIYGSYYSPLRRPFHHLFRVNKNIFLNKNVSPFHVNQLYNRSKICLNIHHSQSKFGVNPRFFEISGSKGFQLVDKKGYIDQNFTTDEIMTYSSEAELMEKIHYAFNNPVLTKQMASRAYEKVTTQHTFTHRIKYVLDVINS
jgi:spore maturation protein CgeB